MIGFNRKLLLIGGLFIAVVIGFDMGQSYNYDSVAQTPQNTSTTPTRTQLLSLVNAERAKHHVAPLKEDSRLDDSAQMKAEDMTKYNYFAHISPKGSPHAGEQGYLYINDVDIYCKTDAENIEAFDHGNTAQLAVDGWILSPEHHKAMIDPKYTLTGFGISGVNVVEHFCQT